VELDQAAKLGGVLDPVLRLAEDHWEQNRAATKFGQDAAIVILNIDAV